MKKKSTAFLILSGISVLAIIYLVMVYWYLAVAKEQGIKQVEKHAVIIAHDLWALNKRGMHAYLDLVAKTEHYKGLAVLTDDGEEFLHLKGPERGGVDKILFSLGIIKLEYVTCPIIYNDQKIGRLDGDRYIRHFYPLFYILLGQLFITLVLVFIAYLVFNRRFLEQQVRERTQKYQDLVNLLPEMVLETDAQGWVTFANEKAMHWFGYTDLASANRNCNELILFENDEGVDVEFLLQTDKNVLEKEEYQVRNVSGQVLPVLVRSTPIYKENLVVGARFIVVDIAERKSLEEQLQLDQKMKSIGIMASGIAHDLNNILSGIINYPELLLNQVPPDSPLIRLIKPMKKAGLRAAAVVADLLTVARGVAAKKELILLNQIIDEYVESPEFEELQAVNSEIRYTFNLGENLSHIYCSEIHVRKSFMNLINNASEAIDGKGQVLVETTDTGIDDPLSTDHGVLQPGSYAILSIHDSGKGIPPDMLTHIFEPFYSSKELGRSGTGLGLAVVWNTLQDHKGGVKVSSSESGTSFHLYFPSSAEKKERKSAEKSFNSYMGSGQSILIVDDEPQQRDIAMRLLESLNYMVDSVASGQAAIEYLRYNRVELVLLDMIMEPGMNGLQTYEELIKIQPGQKAIILSGFSESDDVKKALQIGVGGLVNKPYTQEQLAMAVYEELGNIDC